MTQIVPFRRRAFSAGTPLAPAAAPLNFKGIFDSYIEATQKKWAHDRNATVGGSEVFGCIRKAWYKRNKTPQDPDYEESWGAVRRGDIIENHHVVPAMEHGSKLVGFKMDYAGDEQQTLFAKGSPLSVTPDGLVHGVARNALSLYGIDDLEGDCFMFEIKSIDPRVNLAEEKAIHHGQVQTQMGTVRDNTAFRPMYAVILYVNASFLDDMKPYIVRWDQTKYEVAKARAAYVMECDNPAKLQREGAIDGSCQYCPFQGTCMATTISAMPKNERKLSKTKHSPSDQIQALEGLVEQAREAGRLKKKAEKADALAKEAIKDAMRTLDERKARDANWSVSYGMQEGREGLDKPKMVLIVERIAELVAEKGLTAEVDALLKECGVDPDESRNEMRLLTPEVMMKRGNPFETLRLTYTEPEAADL